MRVYARVYVYLYLRVVTVVTVVTAFRINGLSVTRRVTPGYRWVPGNFSVTHKSLILKAVTGKGGIPGT